MANPPSTIGPFANVPAPGSPIKSDWPQQISQHVTDLAKVVTYTPSLSGVNLGTGGSPSNTASYVFVGSPANGGNGILTASGSIVLGTSGFVVGSSVAVGMPAGFNLWNQNANQAIGWVAMLCGAAYFYGPVLANAAGIVRLMVGTVGGSFLGAADLGAGSPGTWTANNAIWWHIVQGANRTAPGLLDRPETQPA